jgi:hypothetical protein
LQQIGRLKTHFQSVQYRLPNHVTGSFVAVPADGDGAVTTKWLSSAKTSYVYRSGTHDEVNVLIHQVPVTAADYFELGMSVLIDERNYYDDNCWVSPVYAHFHSMGVSNKEEEQRNACNQVLTTLTEKYEEEFDRLAAEHAEKMRVAQERYDRAVKAGSARTTTAFKINYDHDVSAITLNHSKQVTLAKIIYEKAQAKIKKTYEIKIDAAKVEAKAELAEINRENHTAAMVKFQFNLISDAEAMGMQPLMVYKAGSTEEMTLLAAKCPQTADDFYELAMAIKYDSDNIQNAYFDVYHRGNEPTDAQMHAFMCNILSDAAKAGHLLAKNDLIEAAIQGDLEARKHITLKEFKGIAGLSILLPRRFVTADELHKLGSDLLIQDRRKNAKEGEPLIGPYYELADGKNANVLGQTLVDFAKAKRVADANESAARAYADQSSRVSNNPSALFAPAVSRESVVAQTNVQAVALSTVSASQVEYDPSIVSTGSPVRSDTDNTSPPLQSSPSAVSVEGSTAKLDDDLALRLSDVDLSGNANQFRVGFSRSSN